jgi:UDP-N-acetylmuramate dehydrogenase
MKYGARHLNVLEHHPLAPTCTLGVGGPARYFVRATDERDIADAVRQADDHGLPIVVLGGGSNVVFADTGLQALVLHIALGGISVRESAAQEGAEHVDLCVAAGENWDDFVAHCVAHDWAGIECLRGIPGTVGATPIQNVGAYGQEVSSTLLQVRAYDRSERRWQTLSNAECAFSYRHSIFKGQRAGRFIVSNVSYRLSVGGAPSIKYEELRRALSDAGAVTLAQVSDTVRSLRRTKSMVLDPSDDNRRSCGSFFLNPIVNAAGLEAVRKAAAPLEPPAFAQPDGSFKLAAAWLIEQSGLHKGHREGPVGLSTRHTLALVCHEGATARDVVHFAARIRERVFEKFGVRLIPEPVFLGFDQLVDGLPQID